MPRFEDAGDVAQLRAEQLEKCRDAFGVAAELVERFRELVRSHPDDVELGHLTGELAEVMRHLQNTVTCKIMANGLAADHDVLFQDDPG